MSSGEEISMVIPGPSGSSQQEISTVTPRSSGPLQQEISTVTPRSSGTSQQQNRVTKRSNRRRRTIVVGLVTMTILATAIVLHTICLATPNLASFYTTIRYSRHYQFPFENPPISDISMGLWKMCSEAWHFDCVDWASRTKVENTTGTIVSVQKPDWLVVAQYTGVSGLSVAVITEVIVIINVCVCLCNPGKCRLVPVFTCIGALIGGGLVFVSCAYVVIHYDNIPNDIAKLEMEASSTTDLMFKTSSSPAWGIRVEIASVILMWLAGLLSLCNHRGADKTRTLAQQ